jgi:AraC-like DNA-binding protein
MTLYIKNMVCNRCILVVKQELERLGIHPVHVGMGEVSLAEEALSSEQLHAVDHALTAVGFERIDDRKSRLIENIKTHIIQVIHHAPEVSRKSNWSDMLSEALHYDYNYLSNLFSSVEGMTLEQYIIHQKIERVKELLFYDELTLSQIADKLGYSSVAHLSAQFKKVTGLTPSQLKKTHRSEGNRKPLDEVGKA